MEGMHAEKDLLIQALILKPTHESTKKLFKEMKIWSEKHIGENGLRHVDMKDPS